MASLLHAITVHLQTASSPSLPNHADQSLLCPGQQGAAQLQCGRSGRRQHKSYLLYIIASLDGSRFYRHDVATDLQALSSRCTPSAFLYSMRQLGGPAHKGITTLTINRQILTRLGLIQRYFVRNENRTIKSLAGASVIDLRSCLNSLDFYVAGEAWKP